MPRMRRAAEWRAAHAAEVHLSRRYRPRIGEGQRARGQDAQVRASPRRASAQYAHIPGARKAPFPDFIEPAHPTQHDRPPTGDKWVHEIKVDGYRAQLHVDNGAPLMFSRRGNNWTQRFRSIADAARLLPIKHAVIDGEVIVATPDGLSDFAALQSEL